ncbi:uncharacterized protein LOC134813848 [Bolinopsis microptera]|uniref:uncharacterized protein LOC134813848 n=1 Tax=Bolinopsis microptera TaxID=2820187 RepID=UPI003079AB9D
MLLTFGPLCSNLSIELISRKSVLHSFACPNCSQLNELDQMEVGMSGKKTGNTYCDKCSAAVSLEQSTKGVDRRYLCSCYLCGDSNEFKRSELRVAGHKHYFGTCKECHEQFKFFKWSATNLLRYSPSSVHRGHKAPKLEKSVSNVEDGETRVKLVEVTEICDCSDCESSSSSSASKASELKSFEKEPEPKTAEKWREMFGKSEIESSDIFEHFKDSPPERLGAQRPINSAMDIVSMMMYHLDSIYSTAGSVTDPPD